MRRNKFKHNDVFIDLTSLLDVIFIMLMVVSSQLIVQKENLENEYEEKYEALEEEKTEVEIQSSIYSQGISAYESIQYISVVAIFESDNPKERHITGTVNNEKFERIFDLYGTESDDADEWEEFENLIRQKIEEHEVGITVLSLNEGDEKILYRDEQSISNIFANLEESEENVHFLDMINKEDSDEE